MKKMLFVFNPHAGKGLIKNHLCNILNTFTHGGYEVTAYPTQAKNDGMHKIKTDGNRFDIIVVSGGDGTVTNALYALRNRGVRTCVFPSGRRYGSVRSLRTSVKRSASRCARWMGIGMSTSVSSEA